MLKYILFSLFVINGCNNVKNNEDLEKGGLNEKENSAALFKEQKKYFLHLDKREKIETSFVFENKTEHVMSIDTVKTYCSCTKVHFPKYAIKPGETDSINVAISMPRDRTFFSSSVIVYFHGKKPIVLEIIGKRNNN